MSNKSAERSSLRKSGDRGSMKSLKVPEASASLKRRGSVYQTLRSTFSKKSLKKPEDRVENEVIEEEEETHFFPRPKGPLGYEIHEACYDDQLIELFNLVKQNKDLNALDEYQNTGLHYACAEGSIQCVQELLRHEDVNTTLPNTLGDKPLHVASKQGHDKIVKEMIRYGRCNMFSENTSGKPCWGVSSNHKTKMAFVNQINLEKKFLEYVELQNFEKAYQCLQAGANVNTVRKIPLGKGRTKKMNAISILFEKKQNISSSEEQEQDEEEEKSDKIDKKLLRLLLNRGCKVDKKIIDDSTPNTRIDQEVEEMLHGAYLRGKRYDFLKEILQTEKVYNDDLSITMNLFADPIGCTTKSSSRRSKNPVFLSIASESLQNKLVTFWQSMEAVQKETAKNIRKLSSKFKNYSDLILEMDGVTDPDRAEDLEEMEMEYLMGLFGLNMDPYIRFCSQQAFIEDWIVKKKEYVEILKFIEEQERKIPPPRIRSGGFNSLMSKVRNRLFKYRGFIECIMKYIDVMSSEGYLEVLLNLLKMLKDGLDKIDDDAGEITSAKLFLQVKKIFKTKYGPFLQKLCEGKLRRYMFHELNLKAFDLEDSDVESIDLFVFSDCLFVGSRTLENSFYFFKDHKIVWTFHERYFRILIFSMTSRGVGGTKEIDLIISGTQSRNWYKELKKHFNRTADSKAWYWNHIFLNVMFQNDRMVDSFKKTRVPRMKIQKEEEEDGENEEEGREDLRVPKVEFGENKITYFKNMRSAYETMRKIHQKRADKFSNIIKETEDSIDGFSKEEEKKE